MPQVDIPLELLPFGIHVRADVVGFEDEHPSFCPPIRNDMATIFDEAPTMVDLYLHSLIYNLSGPYQILGNRRYMQEVLHVTSLANMAQGYISNMLVTSNLREKGAP